MKGIIALLGLLVAGWRLAGRRMGLTLAIGWAAFPFTAFTLSSTFAVCTSMPGPTTAPSAPTGTWPDT